MYSATDSADSPTHEEGAHAEEAGTTSDFSDRLVTYLAEQDRQRHESAVRMVEALTPRERELVREASSMGYALGHRAGRTGDHSVPPASVLVRRVLEAGRTLPERYTTIADLAHARSVEDRRSFPPS